jgi:hypothetical protein
VIAFLRALQNIVMAVRNTLDGEADLQSAVEAVYGLKGLVILRNKTLH